MSTVNISLPQEQLSLIDRFVSNYGFANRSEFIRSVLRMLAYNPVLVETSAVFPFVSFKKRPLKTIKTEFEKTGLYKKEFITSIIRGLSKSSLYANQKTKT